MTVPLGSQQESPKTSLVASINKRITALIEQGHSIQKIICAMYPSDNPQELVTPHRIPTDAVSSAICFQLSPTRTLDSDILVLGDLVTTIARERFRSASCFNMHFLAEIGGQRVIPICQTGGNCTNR